MGDPPIEWIETKLVEILRQPDLTAAEAADEALAFLERAQPNLLVGLHAAGKEQIMQLFNARPILRQGVPAGPRLSEFVDWFLKYAGEHLTSQQNGAQGATA